MNFFKATFCKSEIKDATNPDSEYDCVTNKKGKDKIVSTPQQTLKTVLDSEVQTLE